MHQHVAELRHPRDFLREARWQHAYFCQLHENIGIASGGRGRYFGQQNAANIEGCLDRYLKVTFRRRIQDVIDGKFIIRQSL